MKLATCITQGQPRPAVLVEDGLLDLWALYEAADLVPPLSLDALFQAGPTALDALRDVVGRRAELGVAPVPLAEAHLDAPLRNPRKLICIGLNYADHCREQNVPEPESPIVFVKFNTAINAPGAAITWPEGITGQVDYEAELAVVIGREARNVTAEDAYNYVAGYTIVNDISARDVQFSDKQWVRGKSFDTFCPMGPYLVTADEVDDPQNLAIQCRLNGAVMQDSNTYEMIFTIPTLIAFISRTCTLLPGDVISTGTPNGVGVFRDPPVFLKPGDTVEVEIEGLGTLTNPVK